MNQEMEMDQEEPAQQEIAILRSNASCLVRASVMGLTSLSSSVWAGARLADLSGVRESDRCSEYGQELSCGAFVLYLVQKRICGSYFSARQHLSQVDEGTPRSVVGVVIGNDAVVSIESGRNGAIYFGTARKSGSALRWQTVGTIKNPSSGDVDLIASDQSMKRAAGNVVAEDIARVRQECSEE